MDARRLYCEQRGGRSLAALQRLAAAAPPGQLLVSSQLAKHLRKQQQPPPPAASAAAARARAARGQAVGGGAAGGLQLAPFSPPRLGPGTGSGAAVAGTTPGAAAPEPSPQPRPHSAAAAALSPPQRPLQPDVTPPYTGCGCAPNVSVSGQHPESPVAVAQGNGTGPGELLHRDGSSRDAPPAARKGGRRP